MSIFKKRESEVRREPSKPTFCAQLSEHIGVACWSNEKESSYDLKLGHCFTVKKPGEAEYLVVKQTTPIEHLPELVEALQTVASTFGNDASVCLPDSVRTALVELSSRLEQVKVPFVSQELNGSGSLNPFM